jgi:hypothetical protein
VNAKLFSNFYKSEDGCKGKVYGTYIKYILRMLGGENETFDCNE